MLAFITTVVAVLGLIGSLVSLALSKRALQKADHAISIEKASHALLMLKGILDEIDQWLIEYQQLQDHLYGKGFDQGNLDFPEAFGEFWHEIYRKFSDFYDRMKHTYPILTKNMVEGRSTNLHKDLNNLKINSFPNYESANYDTEKGYPSNYWDDADLLFVRECAFIRLIFREMIVNLISEKVSKLM